MRILLTGPSGFLGSALARHLVGRGHQLCLLARRTSNLSRLADLAPRVQIERASEPHEISAAIHRAAPDVIVHTACSYGRKGETLLDMVDANLRFGTVLLQAVLDTSRVESGPITFLNAGTALPPDVSLYALSNAQFSAWGATLAVMSPERLQFIDIRLQQMYGPGDDRSKFATHVIEACRQNEPCLALTEGKQQRDFIHIDDVLRAYDRILERHAEFASSDAIDVGTGVAVTIRSFAKLAKQVSGAATEFHFGAVPYRANEAMLCVADTARLRRLGWRQEVSLAEGLKSMLYPLR